MTTLAPARTRPLAIAKPRPEPPPVTSARRPERSKGLVEMRAPSPRSSPRKRGEGAVSAQPEHVLHVEHAARARRALGRDEAGRPQRAMREVHARASLVRELDPLARSGEDHGVIADDIAAAQRREANRYRLALAGHTFAREDGARLEIASKRARRGFA